jgi:hypothetical protein
MAPPARGDPLYGDLGTTSAGIIARWAHCDQVTDRRCEADLSFLIRLTSAYLSLGQINDQDEPHTLLLSALASITGAESEYKRRQLAASRRTV